MDKQADSDAFSTTASTLVEDPTQRFTATGQPMPKQKVSSLGNMSFGFVAQAPQLLPNKFTDDSLIMVPVPIEDAGEPETKSRRSSIAEKLGLKKKKDNFKMVEMTRREYLEKYAKDENGNPIRKAENE